jgi:hypothetical protein
MDICVCMHVYICTFIGVYNHAYIIYSTVIFQANIYIYNTLFKLSNNNNNIWFYDLI